MYVSPAHHLSFCLSLPFSLTTDHTWDNIKEYQEDKTPLFVACMNGHATLTSKLIARGATYDTDWFNNNNETFVFEHIHIMRILVSRAYVPPNELLTNGLCGNGQIEIIRVLVSELGATIGTKHIVAACRGRKLDCLTELLRLARAAHNSTFDSSNLINQPGSSSSLYYNRTPIRTAAVTLVNNLDLMLVLSAGPHGAILTEEVLRAVPEAAMQGEAARNKMLQLRMRMVEQQKNQQL